MRKIEDFEDRSSWMEVAAGVVLFFVWLASLAGSKLPPDIEWGYTLRAATLWALLLLPAGGFLAGLVWDFPRWTYPYAMAGVLFSWYLSNASTPGLTLLGIPLFERRLWGWRAWIPLLLAGIAGLLLRRSWAPLRAFWAHAGRDWSVMTYGLFGCLPMYTGMMFDGIELSYTLAYLLPIGALLVSTSVVYLRARRAPLRRAVLAAGSVLVLALSSLGSVLWYLSAQLGVNIWHVLGWVLVLLGIMFYPALLARARQQLSRE